MRVIVLLLFMLVSGSLQGCFPVVATGVGAGVMLAQDRRTQDAIFDDQTIEATAAERKDEQLKSVMHVNVTSYNHNVLISGEVPDTKTKLEIENIVSSIDKVHVVYNELAVPSASSLVSRSNDALVTSNVKLRFVNDDRFNAITSKSLLRMARYI